VIQKKDICCCSCCSWCCYFLWNCDL